MREYIKPEISLIYFETEKVMDVSDVFVSNSNADKFNTVEFAEVKGVNVQ